jgi:hypothetical protein
METYVEVLCFVLLPIIIALIINRAALKKHTGNLRIVSYKLFRFAVILAIASQISFPDMQPTAVLVIQGIGYIFLALLVFDIFLIYPKKTHPNQVMLISNFILWSVGFVFFINVIQHYIEVSNNNEWKEAGLNPFKNLSLIWEKKAKPHNPNISLPEIPANSAKFNLFSNAASSSTASTTAASSTAASSGDDY